MQINLVPEEGEQWFEFVEKIHKWYGTLNERLNPGPLPPHFLKVIFPKIGGKTIEITGQGDRLGAGFLFPGQFHGGYRKYQLRLYIGNGIEPGIVLSKLKHLIHPDSFVLFDHNNRRFNQTHELFDGFDVGRPSEAEAVAIRAMQKEVWGSEDAYLYPVDIHAENAGLGTSTVVRIDGAPAAFLMGFYRFGSDQLPELWKGQCDGRFRLESQLLGVLPQHRRKGLGFLLKKYQAKAASEAGISLVNWTADPLQFRNAGLNLHRLGAISGEVCPDYIPFRNELNQTPASRVVLSWLVNSKRVKEKLSGQAYSSGLSLDRFGDVVRVNKGCEEANWHAESAAIAVEIPNDWTTMQRSQPQLANRWRKLTDDLLLHYLGFDPGKYILTDIAESDGRKFLIAKRVELVNDQ